MLLNNNIPASFKGNDSLHSAPISYIYPYMFQSTPSPFRERNDAIVFLDKIV